MKHAIPDKFIDPATGCIVYGTLGNIGATDPEVDSMYLTSYYCYFGALLNNEDHIEYERIFIKSLSVFASKYLYERIFIKSLPVFTSKYLYGIFRRYNSRGQNKTDQDPEESYFDNPANLSRDNTMALIIALGKFKYPTLIKAFMKRMLKRYSFFQNTHTHKGVKKFLPDLATPDHWATFIRAYVQASNMNLFKKSLIWLSLCFMDVFSVLQTLLHVFHTHFINSNETGSELNFLACCIQRREVLPTPLALLANLVYYKWRAFPTEVAENGMYEDKAYLAAVQNFFSRGRRHKIMPPIDDLIIEVMKGR